MGEWNGDILVVGVMEKDLGKDKNSKFNNPILRKLGSKLNGLLSEASLNEAFTRKLEPHVAKFISLVCNSSMMKQHMMEIGYVANKLPLGRLSKSTILKSYDVLKRIVDVNCQPSRIRLEQLRGDFYIVTHYDFGFKKMCDFFTDTPQKLKMKLQMVQAHATCYIFGKGFTVGRCL